MAPARLVSLLGQYTMNLLDLRSGLVATALAVFVSLEFGRFSSRARSSFVLGINKLKRKKRSAQSLQNKWRSEKQH
jgi:hypothetical protein